MSNSKLIYKTLLEVKQEIGAMQSHQNTVITHLAKINGDVDINKNRLGNLEKKHAEQKGIMVAIGTFVTFLWNGIVWAVFGK